MRGKGIFSPFMILAIGIISILVASCVPQAQKGTRKTASAGSSATDDTAAPEEPNFTNQLNYFQDGATSSSSSLVLKTTMSSAFYLRGSEVNSYISKVNTSDVQCLVLNFSDTLGYPNEDNLVIAALPRNFFNFSTNQREYYYLVDPSDKSQNQSFCQKVGLINAVGIGGDSIVYSISELCPSCPGLTLSTETVSMRTSGGVAISNIQTSYLGLKIQKVNSSQGGNNNDPTCSSNSDCTSLGYDCCSSGICITDKSVKSTVDQSSADFKNILNLISSGPGAIYDYPDYFNLCPTSVIVTPTPTPTTDPEREALLRFEHLKELYNCTNPIEGEMAICTSVYEDVQNAGTQDFTTAEDDRSFYDLNNNLPQHSIYEIVYAGKTLFKLGDGNAPIYDSADVEIPTGSNNLIGNDDLVNPITIKLKATPGSNAPDDILRIRYKVDGSCVRISSALAKCTKYYIQGQSAGKVNDHFPSSNRFSLPYYADTTRTVKVEVDETTRLAGTHYQLVAGSPAYVEFLGTGLQVLDTQEVKVTYFVDLGAHETLLKSKEEALSEIEQNICQCTTGTCGLDPVYNESNGAQVLVDFQCRYDSSGNTEVPLNQTVLLSAKTVPVKYYDETGIYRATINTQTPAQEGKEFLYTKGNLLKPNNLAEYIGFNEIYGSLTSKAGSAIPAREVKIKSGKTYDIFVDSGTFSSCYYCGNDYYNAIAALFPKNFLYRGGGILPDATTTNERASNTDMRKDDMIFGRACFVPATMIPWSHFPQSETIAQRQRRMQTQHFYFANGYQRDWYGFDYGSIIGSFDGIWWFSIGNQRRIKATSNKLFLAVNAYFGDQTLESTYSVTVSDASTVPASGSTVTSDYQSDGAQCQQYHSCSVDTDCVTKLGWEYSCETVSSIKSSFPRFDVNANEIPDTELIQTLFTRIGSSTGGPKRCVYRGRGSPCTPDFNLGSDSESYSFSKAAKLNMCSQNSYCQVYNNGSNIERFNNRISRFGRSIAYQNASSDVTENDLDTFGLGARIIGRPLEYQGSEIVDPVVQANLLHNNVGAVCLPGRNPSPAAQDLISQHTSVPSVIHNGDKVNGQGVTLAGTLASNSYYSSCNIFDAAGNSFQAQNPTLDLDSATFAKASSNQALSTNLLQELEELSKNTLTSDYDTNQITSLVFEDNRCMRAPGSVCHTDLDCAPNKFIADRVRNIDSSNALNQQTLNKYEIEFWQQELVCSQEKSKTDEDFNMNDNRCCRETGKDLTIGTLLDFDPNSGENFENSLIPGIGISIDSRRRYSRLSTIADVLGVTHPVLEGSPDDACGGAGCQSTAILSDQWKTFSEMASRTCCSGHWVRNFATGTRGIGGGHTWAANKVQNVPMASFQCYNWAPGPHFYTCEDQDEPDDPGCLMRSVPTNEATNVFNWLGTLELLGIPQIAVKSTYSPEIACKVDLADASGNTPGSTTVGSVTVMPDIIVDSEDKEWVDASNARHFSATDMDNYETGIKQIFSPDKISCCIPAGEQVAEGTNPSQCCTGVLNGNTCALPDYANVSVFFNRFVSSAAKSLNNTLFDSNTGYIKSPYYVEVLACQLNVCASGVIGRGVAHSNLKVPGHTEDGQAKLVRRFIDGKDTSNNFSGLADLWEAGLKWNDHVYCVPADISAELNVIDCSTIAN